MSIRPRELQLKEKGRRSAPGRSRTRARRPGSSRRRAPSSTRGRRRRRAAAPCLRAAWSRTPSLDQAWCACRSPVIQMPRIVHHISRFPRMNGWGPRQTRHLCFVILRTFRACDIRAGRDCCEDVRVAPARYDRSTDELNNQSSVPRRRDRASALAWKERCTFSEPELSNKRCQRSVFVIGARGWKYRRRGGALRLQRRPPRACGRMDEARRDRRARARGAPGTSVLLRGLSPAASPLCRGESLRDRCVIHLRRARESRHGTRSRTCVCAGCLPARERASLRRPY